MIYRIDIQHYLSHAIDHFTRDELSHFQYAIISAKITNGGRTSNMEKINQLYPSSDTVSNYYEYNDLKLLEEMYMADLNMGKDKSKKNDREYNWVSGVIYKVFINPLMLHQDIVILCDTSENVYIDILCKILKKEYHIEVIDLNELFIKGKIGPLYIDRDDIHDKSVDIARAAAVESVKQLSSTKEGRLKLISKMNKKEKITKLKDLGISVNSNDKDNLEQLLIDEWVNNEFDDE